MFQLYDIDSTDPDLSKHDFIGQFITTLASLVTSRGQTVVKNLVGKNNQPVKGIITVRVEELHECNQFVTFALQGDKLAKLGKHKIGINFRIIKQNDGDHLIDVMKFFC
jgi:hypothetical protein